MQFQVPQFIETEDKVVGPLTFKQFLYLGAAGLVSSLLFLVLNLPLWIFISIILFGASAIISFMKVNGRPVSVFIGALLNNTWNPKIYVFRPSIPQTKEELMQRQKDYNKQYRKKPAYKRVKIPTFEGISGLRNWLATSKTAIPKREKPLPRNFGAPKEEIREEYEIVKHLTGEKEVAKRVDYR